MCVSSSPDLGASVQVADTELIPGECAETDEHEASSAKVSVLHADGTRSHRRITVGAGRMAELELGERRRGRVRKRQCPG